MDNIFFYIFRHFRFLFIKKNLKFFYDRYFKKSIFDGLFIIPEKPMLLLPLIIILILFFWIIGWTGIGLFIVLIIFFGIPIIAVTWGNIREFILLKKNKYFTKNNWNILEDRIEIELSRYQWFNSDRLKDVASAWNISTKFMDNLDYILAIYAVIHPDQAVFGSVYDKTEEKNINSKVLISLRNIDLNKYYYTQD